MMLGATINIGVKNYRMVKRGACGNSQCSTAVSISFQLEGDFLKAATSDQLDHTVDYDALCQKIEGTLLGESVNLTVLQECILNFSSLISGGYTELSLSCPHIFLKERGLL